MMMGGEGIQLSVPELIFFFFFFLALPQVGTEFGNWFVILQVSLKTHLGHLSSGLFILFISTSH